ncbi:MAG: tRNA (adenosine(37)-N6)-threonylcarbamoyltransferase complex transferase subunit TsaD [Firmicutes bacterium]|nr:tRNA (adenosine(37)-N6)-threonylcarbamoyltransferase complex transferase subunit TsaD [Bacillota bacterium]
MEKQVLLATNRLILGIETSCDETAAAVVANGNRILSNLVFSQVERHALFGGVVPEIASRLHLETINTLIDVALDKAGVGFDDLDALAVSYGPGLVGALLVGIATAKTLAYALDIPLIAVNHLEGHIYANFLLHDQAGHEEDAGIQFPLLGLVASGGHTDLVWVPRMRESMILGQTRDDAAGEAFDKVARALDLGYPGGPIIDCLARQGNPSAIPFPRAYLDEGSRYDFSFSGLKSAVLNYLHQQKQKGKMIDVPDLAASFQAAVVEVLVEKTVAAAMERKPASLLLSGGVAANSSLRLQMRERLLELAPAVKFYCPPPSLCTDNAAMIAAAAFPYLQSREFASLDLNAVPNLSF